MDCLYFGCAGVVTDIIFPRFEANLTALYIIVMMRCFVELILA